MLICQLKTPMIGSIMKITIFTLIGMIRLIGFNIQDIQIHVNIQFCNHNLEIERGRHRGLQAKERICK